MNIPVIATKHFESRELGQQSQEIREAKEEQKRKKSAAIASKIKEIQAGLLERHIFAHGRFAGGNGISRPNKKVIYTLFSSWKGSVSLHCPFLCGMGVHLMTTWGMVAFRN